MDPKICSLKFGTAPCKLAPDPRLMNYIFWYYIWYYIILIDYIDLGIQNQHEVEVETKWYLRHLDVYFLVQKVGQYFNLVHLCRNNLFCLIKFSHKNNSVYKSTFNEKKMYILPLDLVHYIYLIPFLVFHQIVLFLYFHKFGSCWFLA